MAGERAPPLGAPLVPTKVPPEQWKMKNGAEITVDSRRLGWLPDDWGQGLTGPGGMYRVFVSSDGHAYHDKQSVEQHVGRSLGVRDGFNGYRKLVQHQLETVSIEELRSFLSEKEQAAIPSKDDFLFSVISTRRAKQDECIQDIALVHAHFLKEGVEPVWFVSDAEDMREYQKLGLKVVESGKRSPARNKALEEAARLGKVCCQCSDDVSRWEFRPGPRVANTKEALKGAWESSKSFAASPVVVAQFLLAKLRAHDGEQRPHLAGIYPNGITKRAFAREEYETQNYIRGDFFIADLSPVRFDESFGVKEDYEFTVQHIEKHSSVLRCNRWMIQAKHRTPGGASTMKDRRKNAEQQSQEALLARWPQAFRKHATKDREVIMNWPGAEPDSEGEALDADKRKKSKRRREEEEDVFGQDDDDAKEANKTPTPVDTKPGTPKETAKPPTPKDLKLGSGSKEAKPPTPKEAAKPGTPKDGKPGTPKDGMETPKTRKDAGKTTTLDASKATAEPPAKKLRAKDIQQNNMDATIARGDKAPGTEYILVRCAAAVGQKVRDAVGTIQFTKPNGTKAVYAMGDLRYDLKCGFLKLEEA